MLKEVDLIACEDTRHSRKLLAHYQITKPTVSYHEHNERDRGRELIKKLEAGQNIALVSDAGTPLISDPGLWIVQEAIDRGVRVVPIPGPSAFVTAIPASGLPSDTFTFVGFLPARRSQRRTRLGELADLQSALIFYEAPHRLAQTILDLRDVLGHRKCVVAREITKVHEEFLRGSLGHLEITAAAERGEIVLLVEAPRENSSKQKGEATRSIGEEVEHLIREEGLDQKTALKRVARARGIGKSEAYRLMIAGLRSK